MGIDRLYPLIPFYVCIFGACVPFLYGAESELFSHLFFLRNLSRKRVYAFDFEFQGEDKPDYRLCHHYFCVRFILCGACLQKGAGSVLPVVQLFQNSGGQ